ncbi:MAG TPA: hypothetical protein VLB44_20535 [Kofleriaceae bacterium]|nr:hypothetical protein [Kofleriaceae bacterium]
MRLWPVTLLCAATGCAQIFGLDVTSGAPDANLDRTSLQLRRSSVGASVVSGQLDLTGQKADFYTDDGAGGYTKVPGELMPMDTFTAPILMGTPPVGFTTPDMNTHFWALPARAQKGNYAVFEHQNATEAAATSAIMLSITLPTMYASNESFRLLAIGPWTQRVLDPAAGELPAPNAGATTIAPAAPLAYSSFTNVTGGTSHPRIIASDVVLFLRYIGDHLTGVYQTQFDQTDGTDAVNGNLTALTDTPLTATIDPTGYATRYSAVRPATTGLGMTWRVAACPGWSIGIDGGVVLNSGGSAMTDMMINAPHANPFESLGWKTLMTFTTSSSRSYTYMAVPIGLGASMQTIAEPGSSINLNLPAGLPITIRANLTPLTTDGMMLTLDLTKPIAVDAIVDKMSATLWGLSVHEIQVNGTTATRTLVTDAVTTGMPSFKLPPELFQAGHTYVITFRAYEGGFPNAASGDLQTVTLPVSVSSLDGALFTVVAQ